MRHYIGVKKTKGLSGFLFIEDGKHKISPNSLFAEAFTYLAAEAAINHVRMMVPDAIITKWSDDSREILSENMLKTLNIA